MMENSINANSNKKFELPFKKKETISNLSTQPVELRAFSKKTKFKQIYERSKKMSGKIVPKPYDLIQSDSSNIESFDSYYSNLKNFTSKKSSFSFYENEDKLNESSFDKPNGSEKKFIKPISLVKNNLVLNKKLDSLEYNSLDSNKFSIKNLDASFSTSLDVNSIEYSNQFVDSLSQSLKSNKSLESKNDSINVNVTTNIDQNCQSIEKKNFKNAVNSLMIIKNWLFKDKKKTDEEPFNDFILKYTVETVDDNKTSNYFNLSNFVIDSNKPIYYYWLIIISLAILYNLLMIVGRSTFWELQNNWTVFWIIFDYLCDFIYLLDIFINSRTAYLEQGLLVKDIKKLWINYYKSSKFILDILSSLPTDFLFVYTGLYCDFKIPCNVIIRLNRLIKVYRLLECFDKIETKTNYPNAFRISKMIFIILVVIHWNGCLYFYMSFLIGFSSDKWTFNITANPTFSSQYIYCFYWSTLTLTAIGEVPVPVNDVEYLFVIIDFLIGVLIFATIVGNVGSMITNMNQNRAEFQSKMDAVKHYMEFRRISKNLENRVIKWFDYLWSNKQSLDEENVLSVLPDKLKAEIAMHVHLGTLTKVKLFQDCERGLLEQLVLKLRLQIFSPGDYICRKGDVGKEMYIVKKGKLNVVSEDGKTVFATLSDGAVFGELSVLNIKGNKTGNRRTANVCSVGYSDLFCLYKSDLMQVLEDYPEAKDVLIERGKEILRKDGLLDEDKLRIEEENEGDLFTKYDKIEKKLEKLDLSFARLLACFSVSQRRLKQRIHYLENSLSNETKLYTNQCLTPNYQSTDNSYIKNYNSNKTSSNNLESFNSSFMSLEKQDLDLQNSFNKSEDNKVDLPSTILTSCDGTISNLNNSLINVDQEQSLSFNSQNSSDHLENIENYLKVAFNDYSQAVDKRAKFKRLKSKSIQETN